jgi:ergothioneine biosynthesis protein EgtB
MPFEPKDKYSLLLEQFNTTRQLSLDLCNGLSDEDLQAQSMPDASPLKWHLAHTSWAFETFVLKQFVNNYQAFDPDYEYLFNSYYNAIGEQYPRAQRGLLTRPGHTKILEYRAFINEQVLNLIDNLFEKEKQKEQPQLDCFSLIQLAINHEQQHQELMLTDIKHLFSFNPTFPALTNKNHIEKLETISYSTESSSSMNESVEFPAGNYTIGHTNDDFYFDNEGPSHQFYLNSFKLDSMLISNAHYLEFVLDGGYQTASYWLSEAWQKISQQQIKHPLYWHQKNNQWFEYGLNGLQALALFQPVKHISFFEANAFANWKNKRLPTEQEWEVAARTNHPLLKQMFGQLWQWTASSYSPYPGFKPTSDATGEYNGKFMVNQYVLRGGSIVTPSGHIRPSYRNFFYPDAQWQYSGIRLAE